MLIPLEVKNISISLAFGTKYLLPTLCVTVIRGMVLIIYYLLNLIMKNPVDYAPMSTPTPK